MARPVFRLIDCCSKFYRMSEFDVQQLNDEIPNPFRRRRFAFQVLPEEKDRMSRSRKYSFIVPTLKFRLLQLVTARLWEYFVFVLALWSLIPLLFEEQITKMESSIELTYELSRGD